MEIWRKARQRSIEQYLQLTGPTGVLDSLRYLKKELSDIRQIQQFPFVLKYWTDQQISLWQELAKQRWLTISLDASGSFAKAIDTPEFKTGHLFYYVVVVGVDEKIIPLFQMISDKHDTNN